jgi:hypothetical protein
LGSFVCHSGVILPDDCLWDEKPPLLS